MAGSVLLSIAALCLLAGLADAGRPTIDLPAFPPNGGRERGAAPGRAAELVEALRPLFAALPKNEHGNLGPAATGYALHRLFRRMHGWLVKGFAPTGRSWNATLPFEALKDEVPEEQRLLLGQYLEGTGFSLHVTAVFAAAFENLVNQEATERLGAAYKVMDLSPAGDEPWKSVEEALDIYMMSYILGGEKDWTSQEVRARIKEFYPNWPATQRFTRRVLHDVAQSVRETLTFADAVRAVREIGVRYGHWSDHECRDLKQALVKLEEQCPGRVPLGDFYGSAVHGGKWQFSESEDYLRVLGVLDESDPHRPSVVVPNYIDSPANYVAYSKLYSLACQDECVPLMEHLERELAAPSASPEDISALVRNLPSASVPRRRNLPAALLGRLDEVARANGGRVPLHGRLFAQWMHHAYPRECPYPASPGVSHPQLPFEYEKSTRRDGHASQKEMHVMDKAEKLHHAQDQVRQREEDLLLAKGGAKQFEERGAECIPWTCMEEDLLAPPQASSTQTVGVKALATAIAGSAVASTSLAEVEVQVTTAPPVVQAQAELMLGIGSGTGHDAQSRAYALEEALRPLFAALPKNEHGNLGFAAARYALHRLFRRMHGWLVKGVAPSGHTWNASWLAGEPQDNVQDPLRGLFERHHKDIGLGLGEIASLAAAFEDLVQAEAIERLRSAYHALSLSPLDMPWKSVEEVLDVYMMSYILGGEKDWTSLEVRARIKEFYPSWPATQRFTRRVLHHVAQGVRETLTFADAVRAVREIGVRYGHWQDHECHDLKQDLVKLEEQCPGRVPLGDFYGSSVHSGKWQFSESEDYLRVLGVLDESDPRRPSVVVPNYIDSPANYVAYSKLYSLACLDECEPLLGHLERELVAPSASPEEIVALVKGLPSASVPAPRSLPASLLRRLDDVARVHDGRVPLHGRLFAQWMHHAYPRECPYPLASGTTRQQLPFEFKKRTGKKVVASSKEMHVAEEKEVLHEYEAARRTNPLRAECLPWTMQEELIAPLEVASWRRTTEELEALTSVDLGEVLEVASSAAPALLLLVAVASVVWRLARTRGKLGARGPGAAPSAASSPLYPRAAPAVTTAEPPAPAPSASRGQPRG